MGTLSPEPQTSNKRYVVTMRPRTQEIDLAAYNRKLAAEIAALIAECRADLQRANEDVAAVRPPPAK